MLSTLYQGSVKNVLGPLEIPNQGLGVVFDYSDAYSVFDWGRMPDLLPRKGESLAILAAFLFERLETPQAWKDFFKSDEAFQLLAANPLGENLIQIGERLQSEGLRTHYIGLVDSSQDRLEPKRTSEFKKPVNQLLVKQVRSTPPRAVTRMGKQTWDYSESLKTPAPKLIPLETVFRWSVPAGSSLLERAASMGLAIEVGHRFEFPFIEYFSKLESSDRLLELWEAQAISGVTLATFEEMTLKTIWVSGFLRWLCGAQALELADGKLEWGISEQGQLWLVDAIGPDELRILKDGVPLSKEFLRGFYRQSRWYAAVKTAKQEAGSEWKSQVGLEPDSLSEGYRRVAQTLYPALTHALTGRQWFEGVDDLGTLVESMKRLLSEDLK